MPWTRDWGSPTPSSASSDHESEDGSGSKPPKPRVHIVNRDVELARDLDLSTRYDTAIVKINPFTIAASRARKASSCAGAGAGAGQGEGQAGKKRGPVPLVDDGEAKGKDTAWNKKRGGPVPSVLEKDSQMTGGGGGRLGRGGWGGGARKSAWVNAQNERIPRSAPAKKPVKAVGDESKAKGKKGKGKDKDKDKAEDEAEDEDKDEKTQGQAGGKSLLAELDEFVGVAPANGEGKGKGKGQAKGKTKAKAKNTVNDVGAKKSGKKTASKSKTSKAEEDKPVFRRIPAGAAPTAEFPIVQSLERQKLLPTKVKPKPNPAKPISKARFPMSSSSDSSTDSCKRPNVIDIDRLVMGLSDRPNPSKSGGGGGGVGSKDQSGLLQQEKKVGAVGLTTTAQEDDIESIASDDSVRFREARQARVRDEQEGKDIVMSMYFGTTSDVQTQNLNPYPYPSTAFPSLRESGPTAKSDLLMTPRQESNEQNQLEHPSTITHIEYLDEASAPVKDADAYTSSSALPYSSPTAGADTRKLKREDSDGIVRPKPQRLMQIERMAEVAESSGLYVIEESRGRITRNDDSSEVPYSFERGGLSQKRARSPPVGGWSDDTQPMGHTDHVKSKNPFHVQDYQIRPGHNPYADRNIKNPYEHPSFLSPNQNWSTFTESKKSRGNDHGFGGDTASSHAGAGLGHKFSKPAKLFPTSTHSTSSNTMAAPVHQAPSQSQSLKTLTPDAPYKLTLFTPSAPAPQARVQKWTVQTAQGSQYGASAPAARDKDINIPLRHPVTDRLPVFRRAKALDPAPQRRYRQDLAPATMMDTGAPAGPEDWTRHRQMEMREERKAAPAREATNEFRFAQAPSFVTSQPIRRARF